MSQGDRKLIARQVQYYRARALGYDDWFLRRGRFDRGAEWNRLWFGEVEELQNQLCRFNPTGKVLELAGGTGWWTEQLARYADHVTTVDASPEALAINRKRLREKRVRYVQSDVFEWTPEELYDVVFFSFWLSHVPPGEFASFWTLVMASLREGSRLLFYDSLSFETVQAARERLMGLDDFTTTRRLKDGQEFRIVKVFYEPTSLEARLRELEWSVSVKRTSSSCPLSNCRPNLPHSRPDNVGRRSPIAAVSDFREFKGDAKLLFASAVRGGQRIRWYAESTVSAFLIEGYPRFHSTSNETHLGGGFGSKGTEHRFTGRLGGACEDWNHPRHLAGPDSLEGMAAPVNSLFQEHGIARRSAYEPRVAA